MKTDLEMRRSITQNVKNCMALKLTQTEIIQAIEKLIKKETFTASGKRRLPAYRVASLWSVVYTAMDLLAEQKTIFCYWYDGQAYAVRPHLKGLNMPSTRDLEKLIPAQKLGDCKSGFYYIDGLKPYFVYKNEESGL